MAKQLRKQKRAEEIKKAGYHVGDEIVFYFGSKEWHRGIILWLDINPNNKPVAFRAEDGSVKYAHFSQIKRP